MKTAILAALLALPAFASNQQVVAYEAEVVSAVNPHVAACVAGQAHYNDVVSSCHAGASQVRFVAVADSAHCSQGELVRFVRNGRVQVRVQRNALALAGLSGYNQSVVSCTQVVKVRNRVVRRRVVSRFRVFGALQGANARQVKVVVDRCR